MSIFLLYCTTYAYTYRLSGKIFDSVCRKGIGYAIIQIKNTSIATSANSEGYFEIELPFTKNILITKCIGYDSDTLVIDSSETKQKLNIYLNPSLNLDVIPEQTRNISAPEIVGHLKTIRMILPGGQIKEPFPLRMKNPSHMKKLTA